MKTRKKIAKGIIWGNKKVIINVQERRTNIKINDECNNKNKNIDSLEMENNTLKRNCKTVNQQKERTKRI